MPEPVAEPVTARLIHASPGRIRLRLTGRSAVDFLVLRQRLAALPGIEEVRANPRTGSLLIRGSAVTPQSLQDVTNALGWRINEPQQVRPLIDHFFNGFNVADAGLRRATGGQLDIASLAIVALLGAAAVQILRGRLAAPAITILWYAASTVLMAHSARHASG